ncbi:MAG: metal-dependent hydrolase [Nevskiaceae bacterium]|nr:MAG: metal-dependent hydrolase [Nevskiaceae bacterium]
MTQTHTAATRTPSAAGRHEGASFPVRRPDFDFSKTPEYWFDNNPMLTHFMNGMAALFPDGEMFFVKSVRAVRDQIRDEALQKEISAFIGQEAMHSKAHLALDDYLHGKGVPIKEIEKIAVNLLGVIHRYGSKKLDLSVTCALEHFTATWAQQFLTHDATREVFNDPTMRKLWTWHAVEESEHKAVAYDTYKAIGGDYATRAAGMAIAMAGLTAALVYIEFKMVRHDRQLTNWRAWGQGLKHMFGLKGFFTPTIPKLFDYFRPGFHPNDHDVAEALAQRRSELAFDAPAGAVLH